MELYKDKKLLDLLLLAREFNGRIELDLKQTLSDIEIQNIYINEIINDFFDKPLKEERQRELEEDIKKHQELELQQRENINLIKTNEENTFIETGDNTEL